MQIKVWLLGISPLVWRRLLVPSTFTGTAARLGVVTSQGAEREPCMDGTQSNWSDNLGDISDLGLIPLKAKLVPAAI